MALYEEISMRGPLLLMFAMLMALGCSTASYTRIVCPSEGPITVSHDPGLRRGNYQVVCSQTKEGVSFSMTQTEEGLSPIAGGTLGVIGLGIGTMLGAPLEGLAVGTAADAAVNLADEVVEEGVEEAAE